MSLDNPTEIKIGARGSRAGHQYTVQSRVVLSVAIAGQIYYWHEYYLKDETGATRILVYDEDDAGWVWRLFAAVPLPTDLYQARLGAMRVGEHVRINELNLRVTQVNRSFVRHIEGVAPEGLVLGEEADFFNAEDGGWMFVASRTGMKLECFFGGVLSAKEVATMFGLPWVVRRRFLHAGSGDVDVPEVAGSALRHLAGVLVGVVLVIMVVSFWSEETEHTRPEPPARQSAAVVKLPLQAGGKLEEQGYATISAHAVVEVGQQGLHYDRHEYSLRPSRGEGVLLVQAPEGFAGEWLWLEPVPVPDGLTPQVLGALRVGQAREWGDLKLPITRLQVGKVVSAEPGRAREFWPASMHYALLARRDGEWQVARWTEESVRCYIGRTLSDREVLAAFAAH